MYFDNPTELNYYEGGAHFRYKDLCNMLENLIKFIPRFRHGRSESNNVQGNRGNIVNINISGGNKKQSRNIKPLIQSLTQKLSEITKDRGENSINIINKNNTIEGQGNDSVEKGEDKKENKIQLINNIFIQEENNDLLTRNMILKKLYRKHKNIRSISNNNKSNSYIKNKSSNVITENTIAKKTINLSHNKYTRNKPVINEMLKAANNTKNDSYIQNISSSLQKTSSLINKINLSLGANTINKLINQNKNHSINKTKISNIKKHFLQIPHNSTTNNNNNNSINVIDNFGIHNISSNVISKNNNNHSINNYINLSFLKPSYGLKAKPGQNNIIIQASNKKPPQSKSKKRNKSLNFYSNTIDNTNQAQVVTTTNNNEISTLSDLNTSHSKDNKEPTISISQINATNNNNNIILRPKINISFVNNITQKSPSRSKPVSKPKTNEMKSRNKQIDINKGNTLIKLNTTIKNRLLNDIFQTNQQIMKRKETSPGKNQNEIENNVNTKTKKKFNLIDHYSTLQKKINGMKSKNNFNKISTDFDTVIHKSFKGNNVNTLKNSTNIAFNKSNKTKVVLHKKIAHK